jgi:hypothetical protein
MFHPNVKSVPLNKKKSYQNIAFEKNNFSCQLNHNICQVIWLEGYLFIV